ncbi:CoA-transferase [Desulfosporosinus sp. Sb-LF]|uniref:CoA-transferase subunit beta n=1 Tax=Desulfosporosinus sp. Sb-LF TaxID=2560027 RepID=UPI00107FD3E3|nr:CoA-transferase [Desulfosporosinus sp. Sb-LF]TGE32201.1 CoA-transferase [Desulfosporosinus sp. Sb-LF]
MHYGPAEMMVVALAREIKNGDVVFHGLASPVPMTAVKLAKAFGRDFTLINITGGVDPDWEKPAVIGSTLSINLFEGGVANFGLDEIFDLACTDRVDISMLSLVQISPRGEINMSFVGGEYDKPKVRLPGGAGSATLTPVSKQTLIWKTKHDIKSFVPEVTFCTAKANSSKQFKVITNLCTFLLKNGQLVVQSIHPYSNLAEVQANTGWEITQTEIPYTSAPTEVELALIEKVDPNRIRYIEF